MPEAEGLTVSVFAAPEDSAGVDEKAQVTSATHVGCRGSVAWRLEAKSSEDLHRCELQVSDLETSSSSDLQRQARDVMRLCSLHGKTLVLHGQNMMVLETNMI